MFAIVFQTIRAKLKSIFILPHTQRDIKGQSTVKPQTTTTKNLGPSKTLNWKTGAKVNIWFSVTTQKNISGRFFNSTRYEKC